MSSSSSSLLELLELDEERVVVVGLVRELDDETRDDLCDVFVRVVLGRVTDEVRSVRELLLRSCELDEELVRVEEDTDLLYGCVLFEVILLLFVLELTREFNNVRCLL